MNKFNNEADTTPMPPTHDGTDDRPTETAEQQLYVIQHYERKRFDRWERRLFTAEQLEERRKPEWAGHHKIGIAADPERRMRQLQNGTPFTLRLVTTIDIEGDAEVVESEVHNLYYNPTNDRGEWFFVPREHLADLKEIEVLRQGEAAQIRERVRRRDDHFVHTDLMKELREARQDLKERDRDE